MTWYEGLAIASGLAIGYWLVSVFTRPQDDHLDAVDDTIDSISDNPGKQRYEKAVSGFYFAHPQSKYFGVGKLDRDQVTDLAQRKGMDPRECERWLGPWLNYDPA